MSSRFDLLLFDLGNVLVKFDHAIIARKLARLTRRPALLIVSQFIRSGLGEKYDEGKMTTEEFVERAIRELSLKVTPREFRTIWNEMFFADAEMERLVKTLKRSYPLFIISDTNPLHFRYIQEKFPVVSHFSEYILSYEVGIRKPRPEIFKEALRRAGTVADKVFFTDDRRENVQAASKLGFHAFQYKGIRGLEKELKKVGILS